MRFQNSPDQGRPLGPSQNGRGTEKVENPSSVQGTEHRGRSRKVPSSRAERTDDATGTERETEAGREDGRGVGVVGTLRYTKVVRGVYSALAEGSSPADSPTEARKVSGPRGHGTPSEW